MAEKIEKSAVSRSKKVSIDFNKAFRYIFDDPDWKKKALPLFVVSVVIAVLQMGIRMISNLIAIALDAGSDEVVFETVNQLAGGVSLVSLSFIVIPFSIYIQGYLLKISRSILSGEEYPPDHGGIADILSDGFKLSVIELGYTFMVVFLLALVSIPFVAGVFISLFSESDFADISSVLLIIGGGLFFALVVLAVLAVSVFYAPLVAYSYLREGTIWSGFHFKKILSWIKFVWKDILLITLLNMVANVSLGVVSFVLCCVGFIVQPAIQTYLIFFSGNLTGQMYYMLQEKLKNPD